jgi:hypothetical protein
MYKKSIYICNLQHRVVVWVSFVAKALTIRVNYLFVHQIVVHSIVRCGGGHINHLGELGPQQEFSYRLNSSNKHQKYLFSLSFLSLVCLPPFSFSEIFCHLRWISSKIPCLTKKKQCYWVLSQIDIK